MGTKGYTLCAVSPGSAYNQMQATVYTAGTSDGLPDGYTAFVPVVSGGTASVAAYDSATGQVDVYALPTPGQGFGSATGSQTLAAGWDMLLPFTLGDQGMVLGYAAGSGTFQFYSLSGATFQAQNTFTGTSPATTSLTTVVPFLDWDGSTPGGSYLLCYDMNTGQVAIYQLTAGENGAVEVGLTWQPDELWATGWTRFGPFQFGPENFFIKTNVDYNTVYIDHIMDSASLGTHPAAKGLPLPLDLTAVTPFTLLTDPCFATYLASSGAVTLNRFQGNLQGWFEGAQATAISGAGTATFLPGGDSPLILIY